MCAVTGARAGKGSLHFRKLTPEHLEVTCHPPGLTQTENIQKYTYTHIYRKYKIRKAALVLSGFEAPGLVPGREEAEVRRPRLGQQTCGRNGLGWKGH